MTLRERISAGLLGKYTGLSNGFDRINKYIFGIQRGIYYLLGGLSGTYKSTLCDFIVQNLMEDSELKHIECNVFYYSFEIDELTKKCQWLSAAVFKKYGVVIPPEKIKGMGDFRMTLEEQKLADSVIDEVEERMNKIHFIFDKVNPTGIYNYLWKWGDTHGTILKEPYVDTEGVTKYRISGYKPNNPDAYNVVIMDHMALMKKERGFQTKEVIDKYSEYCIELKNLFGFTFINLQQFNQQLSSVERMKFKGADLSPQQGDFRDSTNPFQDSDVVLGIMNPSKMDISECLDYDIKKLGERFIMLKIIKNRLARDNVAIGVYVDPQSGQFTELPDPSVIQYVKYPK